MGIEMKFRSCPQIAEIIIIEPEVHRDKRGFFVELHHQAKYDAAGIRGPFVQDNLSSSRKGTLRGLHYQLHKPQGKAIWALAGEIYDVAVDIRRGSPTCGQWFGTVLSDVNMRGLYIPPKFAHGFCVLSEEAEVFYKCTDFYAPEDECCIRWDDPEINIDWPIATPTLSAKDADSPFLREAALPD
jgi:dTDP-4-dehydrorhamnose 3,5-epimerase